MRMRRQTLAAAAAALALVAMAGSAEAVTIVNPGFESGSLAGWSSQLPGGYGSGAWVSDNVADQGGQWGSPFPGALPGTADGTHYAQLSGHGPEGGGSASPAYAWQDVGDLEPDTTYVLTISIGKSRFDWIAAPGTIALINGTDQTGTVLGSAGAAPLYAPSWDNDFRDLSVTVTTGSAVTGHLTVLLTTPGGFSTYSPLKFDNVRLEATAVPEPMSLGVGLGAAGLLALRRRRPAAL